MGGFAGLSMRKKLGVLALVCATLAAAEGAGLVYATRSESPGLLLLGLSCGAILLWVGSLRLLGKITRPVEHLVEASRAAALHSSFGARIPKLANDEIGELADTINRLLIRIEKDSRLGDYSTRLEAEIAQRTQLSMELLEAKEVAEAAGRAKLDFLANMSHEIRTPMTAILGNLELLFEGPQAELDAAQLVATIRRAGSHLLRLIDDILDISRIESGLLEIERIDFSLVDLVREVLEIVRVQAGEKGLRLDVRYPDPFPRTIRTDPTRLRQILLNLVCNAIKFTREGQIELTIGLEPSGDCGHERLRIEVKDSGIGMTEEEMAIIFDVFTQADSSTTRCFGGSGLGLAISARLAQRLGGELAVRSVPGIGSTFELRLDVGLRQGEDRIDVLREDSPLEPKAYKSSAAESRFEGRVLLVEDGPDNQRLIRALLRIAGLRVELAENGRIGLEKALHEPFDVILMDMQMPVMDGYAATRTLRTNDYRGPIIALTAKAMSGNREECLEAGCDDYLTKPIDQATLLAALGRYLEPASRV